jgi:hypothetical protein
MGGGVVLAVAAISAPIVPDDGGVIVVATGVFPIGEDVTVDVQDGGSLDRRCYSGVVGQGINARSLDGFTLSFVVPALPIGGPYDLYLDADGFGTLLVSAILTVIHRSYTTRHYALRRSSPPPRNVGPLSVQDESKTGQIVGPWEGLYSAIADELYDHAGFLMTRVTVAALASDASLTVEGTDRYPDSGRLALGGETVFYASKTNTSFDGITDDAGDPGLPIDVRVDTIVMDFTRLTTQIDNLKASFVISTADSDDLDVIGRNYGIHRPVGLDTELWRALLYIVIAIEAQTLYACEQILDVLFGAGNYELYEDAINHPHKIFVDIKASLASDQFQGKTWLVGLEPQARTAATTVDVDNPVAVPYGVWDATDPNRTGTNYGYLPITGSTDAVTPQRYTSVGSFTAQDVGKPVIMGSEAWRILAVLSADLVVLGQLGHGDGITAPGEPDVFETVQGWFAPWMIGHQIDIPSGVEAGTFVIAEYLTPKRVRLTGAAFATALIDVAWELQPNFGTASPVTAEVLKLSASSVTITTPVAMPVNVLVDYSHVPSAQLLIDEDVDGNDQYPFYLWDGSFIAQFFLDLITAAGVKVVVELK